MQKIINIKIFVNKDDYVIKACAEEIEYKITKFVENIQRVTNTCFKEDEIRVIVEKDKFIEAK